MAKNIDRCVRDLPVNVHLAFPVVLNLKKKNSIYSRVLTAVMKKLKKIIWGEKIGSKFD